MVDTLLNTRKRVGDSLSSVLSPIICFNYQTCQVEGLLTTTYVPETTPYIIKGPESNVQYVRSVVLRLQSTSSATDQKPKVHNLIHDSTSICQKRGQRHFTLSISARVKNIAPVPKHKSQSWLKPASLSQHGRRGVPGIKSNAKSPSPLQLEISFQGRLGFLACLQINLATKPPPDPPSSSSGVSMDRRASKIGPLTRESRFFSLSFASSQLRAL